MLKRSSKEIRYQPIYLDETFPIVGGEPFQQGDEPIRYLHFHDCLELGYCYSGSGIFMVGEKILVYEAGDTVFINASEIHLAQSAPGTSSSWTWIYLDPIRLVGHAGTDLQSLDPTPLAGPNFANVIPGSKHPDIKRVIAGLVSELTTQEKGRKNILRALVWQLMILMDRLHPKGRNTLRHHTSGYDRVVPALQFVSEAYAKPMEISRLASLCYLSEPQFRRIFRKAIGQSPREYWHAVRLRMAASLLKSTSRSILEISQDVGFETLSSFNRLFLKHFGMAPRSWRKQ